MSLSKSGVGDLAEADKEMTFRALPLAKEASGARGTISVLLYVAQLWHFTRARTVFKLRGDWALL
jgi:hypothetical protein